MLKIATLTEEFVNRNTGLKEALHDKGRPHGIVMLKVNNLNFAIPLRSNLNHRFGVVLDELKRDGKTLKRGLDFTKAVLIRDVETDVGKTYIVPKSQKTTLVKRKKMIISQFNKYVREYIGACERGAKRTLDSQYKFSTLVNYHVELGISEQK